MGFGARQSQITTNGGNAPAPRHLSLDGTGFSDGIVGGLSGILFDQAAGIFIPHEFSDLYGYGFQLRPLRQ